jgi:hypothetical protein
MEANAFAIGRMPGKWLQMFGDNCSHLPDRMGKHTHRVLYLFAAHLKILKKPIGNIEDLANSRLDVPPIN